MRGQLIYLSNGLSFGEIRRESSPLDAGDENVHDGVEDRLHIHATETTTGFSRKQRRLEDRKLVLGENTGICSSNVAYSLAMKYNMQDTTSGLFKSSQPFQTSS